jgi:hypothetical protein
MLNQIRTLTHPLHSVVQNFPVTAAGVTAMCVSELKKKVKEVVNYMEDHRGARKPGFSEFDLSPLPAFTYTHAKGCIHSDKPDVVLKSRADVQGMDELARQRLATVNALLDAGVDHDLSADLDGESNTTAWTQDGLTPNVNGDDDDDEASIPGSPTPSLSSSSSKSDEELSLEQEERLMAKLEENELRSRLRQIKTRLEECLATSSLAKAVYFKRCNGRWVSALGDVLPHGHEYGQDIEAEVLNGISSQKHRDRKSVSSTLTTLTFDTTTNTNSSGLTNSTSATFMSSSISPSILERNATSISSGIHVDTSISSYGYAMINTEDLLGQAARVLKLDSLSASLPLPKQTSDGSPASLKRHKPASSPRFEYLTSMLMAREELVRIGQASEKDLALTSWGYNRLVKKQAKALEEETRAN